MTRDVVLMINATFSKRASREKVGLENKVRAAMQAILKENWLETEENNLFRSAIIGVMLDIGDECEDGKLILNTMTTLNKFGTMLNAAQAGVEVNIASVLPDDPSRLLPLLGWWHEVKASHGRLPLLQN